MITFEQQWKSMVEQSWDPAVSLDSPWDREDEQPHEDNHKMWVYVTIVEGHYEVGHYRPSDGEWVKESCFSDRSKASARVNYLNGGTGGGQKG